jgi:hypothetical protein
MIYRLIGYDTFEGEYYPLGTHKLDNGTTLDGMKPDYGTREEALEDAWKRLDELERTQPSGSSEGPGSGGQGSFGIQDRVFLIHPDGYHERVWPRGTGNNQ